MFLERFQVRAATRRAKAVGDDVVDVLLAFLHAPHVILKGNPLGAGFIRRGSEAHELQDRLAVGEILRDALLHGLAELVPELAVFLRIELAEQVQHALGEGVAHRLDVGIVLQRLAGDVEGEIAGVDHAAHEPQVQRQELLRVVHDEHALDVELDATRRFPVPQVEGGAARDVDEAHILLLAFDAVVAPTERVFVVVRDVLVERLVFVVRHVGARARPERRGGVHGLLLRRFRRIRILVVPRFLPGVTFSGHHHRHTDVIRVLAHDLAQPKPIRELVGVALQLEDHAGAALGVWRILHRELVLALRRPAHAGLRAGAFGLHFHLVGDHEGAVEAHPELADELGVPLCLAREVREELGGAGLGDGAQVGDELVAAHADAVVRHRDGLRVGVERHANLEVWVVCDQLGVRERVEAEPVDGVRGVRDELTQEDLPVGVQGVDHQVQQLLGFGLEAEGLFGHARPKVLGARH